MIACSVGWAQLRYAKNPYGIEPTIQQMRDLELELRRELDR